jgi:hypothetical protein
MPENEHEFNERLARMIRLYWAEQGYFVHVWTTLTWPPSQSGTTPHQIHSNMTNGYPPSLFNGRERAHV